MRVKPESLEPEAPKAVEAAPAHPTGSIPEGTVLGDGHIKFVLCRVDTRLLHGQVATTWTRRLALTASSWFPTPSLMTSCARP